MEKIITAIRNGDVAQVNALLDSDPQLAEAKDGDGLTVLHYAALHGSPVIVSKVLARHPGLIDMRDKVGDTALFCAPNAEILGILLKDHPEHAAARNGKGRTLLHDAIEGIKGDNAGLVAFLLDEHPSLAEISDTNGRTPLHMAAFCGDVQLVHRLLEGHPERARVKDKADLTPLDLARIMVSGDRENKGLDSAEREWIGIVHDNGLLGASRLHDDLTALCGELEKCQSPAVAGIGPQPQSAVVRPEVPPPIPAMPVATDSAGALIPAAPISTSPAASDLLGDNMIGLLVGGLVAVLAAAIGLGPMETALFGLIAAMAGNLADGPKGLLGGLFVPNTPVQPAIPLPGDGLVPGKALTKDLDHNADGILDARDFDVNRDGILDQKEQRSVHDLHPALHSKAGIAAPVVVQSVTEIRAVCIGQDVRLDTSVSSGVFAGHLPTNADTAEPRSR